MKKRKERGNERGSIGNEHAGAGRMSADAREEEQRATNQKCDTRREKTEYANAAVLDVMVENNPPQEDYMEVSPHPLTR